MKSPWHPIETAPRNGRAVLVMEDDWPGTPSGRAEECVGHNTYVAEWWGDEGGEGGRWVCYMDQTNEPTCPIQPTHWMPLPPPPAAFEEADEENRFMAEEALYDEAKAAVEAAGGVWPFEKL